MTTWTGHQSVDGVRVLQQLLSMEALGPSWGVEGEDETCHAVMSHS